MKNSGIIDEYPGFDPDEMELRAEFENLRPFSSGVASFCDGDLIAGLEKDYYGLDLSQTMFNTNPRIPSFFSNPPPHPL